MNNNQINFLEPDTMLLLYARGAFPMADEKGVINWYMPEIRTIIPLNNFNFPRSLKKIYYSNYFEYKFDTQIIEVIKNCADRKETWISNELIEAYKGLIKKGNLHSVEVYKDDELVGGLYGVTYRGAFFGESMFSKISQASKCALIKLIEHLNEKKFKLLDVQYQTEHLSMFGAVEISFEEYESLLMESYKTDTKF
ncbi:MAG: leucyl/phenylalanyl-tRNA--protein transferase [Melioribacteraceae bacterium]|nr:leucyl/phenylalanyl-tRNA--protein transferase [Melioribacteraceae bacterium]